MPWRDIVWILTVADVARYYDEEFAPANLEASVDRPNIPRMWAEIPIATREAVIETLRDGLGEMASTGDICWAVMSRSLVK